MFLNKSPAASFTPPTFDQHWIRVTPINRCLHRNQSSFLIFSKWIHENLIGVRKKCKHIALPILSERYLLHRKRLCDYSQLTNSLTGVCGRWLTRHTASHQAPWLHRQHGRRSHERRWDTGHMSTGYRLLPAASLHSAYGNRCTSVDRPERTIISEWQEPAESYFSEGLGWLSFLKSHTQVQVFFFFLQKNLLEQVGTVAGGDCFQLWINTSEYLQMYIGVCELKLRYPYSA